LSKESTEKEGKRLGISTFNASVLGVKSGKSWSRMRRQTDERGRKGHHVAELKAQSDGGRSRLGDSRESFSISVKGSVTEDQEKIKRTGLETLLI